MKRKYRITGTVWYRYETTIDEEVWAESREDAEDRALAEHKAMHTHMYSDEWDDQDVTVEEIEQEEISEAERMRHIGAPVLPGFEGVF